MKGLSRKFAFTENDASHPESHKSHLCCQYSVVILIIWWLCAVAGPGKAGAAGIEDHSPENVSLAKPVAETFRIRMRFASAHGHDLRTLWPKIASSLLRHSDQVYFPPLRRGLNALNYQETCLLWLTAIRRRLFAPFREVNKDCACRANMRKINVKNSPNAIQTSGRLRLRRHDMQCNVWAFRSLVRLMSCSPLPVLT